MGKTIAQNIIAAHLISGDGPKAKVLMKKHIENAKNHMMGCVNING